MPYKRCTYKKIKRKFYKFPAGHEIQGTASTIPGADRLIRRHMNRSKTRTRKYSIIQQSDNLECHIVYNNGVEKVIPFTFGLLCRPSSHIEYEDVYAVYPYDLPF